MTQEQKDWFVYGKLKAAWLAVRELEPGEEHILTPALWDARKKAHRWLKKGVCHQCAEFTPYNEDAPQEDGRCALGNGTWCTHTRADDTCNCFMWR